jgi:hypothetical protein
MPKTMTKPILHLVQTAAAEQDTISGRSSGLVEAYLHRPAWGVPLDLEDLPDLLAEAEVYADVQSLGTIGSTEDRQDRARLSVRGIWHGVPVIGDPNGAHIFGQTLAGRVATYLSRGRRGEVQMAREGGLGSTSALAAAVAGQGEARITSTTKTGDERRVTVDVVMAFRSTTVGTGLLADGVRDYLPTMTDNCEPGLGRVASVEMIPHDDGTNRHSDALKVSARFVFLSRLPA